MAERPIWNRETESMDQYRRNLVSYLGVDVPTHQFATSGQLVELLENLADARAQVIELQRVEAWNKAKITRMEAFLLIQIAHQFEPEPEMRPDYNGEMRCYLCGGNRYAHPRATDAGSGDARYACAVLGCPGHPTKYDRCYGFSASPEGGK